ncbi:MAG: UvrD-helicase domain-containing protein [Spirochaetaceae bacterium]|jgi:ATP-dependent helicase/nuclease subunit A|nr:UvrD-helicase domain-containing protein [Spirochaetaceae bacterium]
MKLDEEQKAACLADRNAVVSAGAGSGKTTVLAERYVRLVTERDLAVSEVLALTFTRKAAAEMYERIFKRLSRSQAPGAKEKLAQFDQARISTLDSFCAAVTRGACSQYGISGDFRLDEAELGKIAEETAVDMVMRHRGLNSIRRLVSVRGFEKTVGALFAAVAQEAFGLVRPGGYADLGRKQIDYIIRETASCAAHMASLCETIAAVDIGKKPSDNLANVRRAALRAVDTLRAPFEDADITALRETAGFFESSASFTLRFGKTAQPALLVLTDAATSLKKELAPRLKTLTGMLLFKDDIREIGAFLDEYERAFLERKRARGLLSFRDASDLAVDILTNDTDLRNYYKRHIKAVMIDEFQDNNETQKNLLYLLAERDGAGTAGVLPRAEDLSPDKLFFVGDEKQSIYRFRGADVSVFRGLSRELGAQAGITLRANYRSAPLLAAFFNALFPGVFGPALESFEAAFSPMRVAPVPLDGTETAPVEVLLQELSSASQDGADGADEADEAETAGDLRAGGTGGAGKEIGEALAVAQRIVSGVERGEFGFGGVAVLFRNTTCQSGYERVFRDAGIPFSAADPRGLFLEGPANDFYALLRLTLFPLDRKSYAAVLRSPFIRLDDRSVFRILLEEEEPDAPFPADIDEKWFDTEAEKERYRKGAALFAYLAGAVDSRSIAEVVDYLWYETGYRAYLLYYEPANLEHFGYLYNLALDADRRRLSMAAFLDELAPRIGTSGKSETVDVPEERENVLFITVHKSKGLEFQTVVLADAGSEGYNAGNRSPYFLDPEFGPVLNFKMDTHKRDEKPANDFYERGRDLTRRKEAAELKRLFYVAATRAKARLIIAGSRKTGARERAEIFPDADGETWARELIRRGRRNNRGEPVVKSFLDLFSQGVRAAGHDLPGYAAALFTPPDRVSYEKAVRDLAARTAARTDRSESGGAGASRVDIAAFYRTPCTPPFKAGAVLTSPTHLAFPSRIAQESEAGGERLPALRSDAYLEAPLPHSGESRRADISQSVKQAFGELCHRMIEKSFDRQVSPVEAARDAADLFHGALFSEEALGVMAEEARGLARAFLETPWGKEARDAATRRTEFRFILPVHEKGARSVLIRGAMDLIYEARGECVIIDFKTDRYLNRAAHTVQLACYRLAAPAFSDLPARTLLAYLRDMRVVEVAAALSAQDLRLAAQPPQPPAVLAWPPVVSE